MQLIMSECRFILLPSRRNYAGKGKPDARPPNGRFDASMAEPAGLL